MQFAVLSLGAAACSTFQKPPMSQGMPAIRDNLLSFGAIPDGTFNPVTRKMTGTDNTAAINAALATGRPVKIPPGIFYYSGSLNTDIDGSGLVGSGSQVSRLITDKSLNRHIGVLEGTKDTTWTRFGMVGPFTNDGKKLNRALTIGIAKGGDGTSTDPWDATGTWVDDLAIQGYCVGMHVAGATNVKFGKIEVFEAGDSRAEPGSYGITCSGSNLRGDLLRAINTTTRARHALYYTGPANDCFVRRVEAKGFDFAAVQNRATKGGGRRNGFEYGHFQDCNTYNSTAETLRGVVNFACADDQVVKGAGGALIGHYAAIECGGFPGPSLRYMPNSQCGTVDIYRHSGDFVSDQRYGAHIFMSDNVRLPTLNFVGELSNEQFDYYENLEPIVVEKSTGCYGGGVQAQPG